MNLIYLPFNEKDFVKEYVLKGAKITSSLEKIQLLNDK